MFYLLICVVCVYTYVHMCANARMHVWRLEQTRAYCGEKPLGLLKTSLCPYSGNVASASLLSASQASQAPLLFAQICSLAFLRDLTVHGVGLPWCYLN